MNCISTALFMALFQRQGAKAGVQDRVQNRNKFFKTTTNQSEINLKKKKKKKETMQ